MSALGLGPGCEPRDVGDHPSVESFALDGGAVDSGSELAITAVVQPVALAHATNIPIRTTGRTAHSASDAMTGSLRESLSSWLLPAAGCVFEHFACSRVPAEPDPGPGLLRLGDHAAAVVVWRSSKSFGDR